MVTEETEATWVRRTTVSRTSVTWLFSVVVRAEASEAPHRNATLILPAQGLLERDGMQMNLSTLLVEALDELGYRAAGTVPLEGRSGTQYAAALVAERHGARFLIDVLLNRAANQQDAEALGSIAADVGLSGAVLVAFAGAEVDPGHPQVTVLERDELARAAGARLISRAVAAAKADPEASLEAPPASGATPPFEDVPASLIGETEKNASQPEPPSPTVAPAPTPAPVVPEESDAEWLDSGRDPVPTPAAEAPAAPAVPTAQARVADDGSDAEWLDSGRRPAPTPAPEPEPVAEAPASEPAPSPGQDPASVQRITERIPVPDADAEWLPSKPRNPPPATADPPPAKDPTPSPSPAPVSEPPGASQAEGGSGAEWLPSEPRTPEVRAPRTPTAAATPNDAVLLPGRRPTPGRETPAEEPPRARAENQRGPIDKGLDRVVHTSGDAAWMPSKPRIARPWEQPAVEGAPAEPARHAPPRETPPKRADSGFLSGPCIAPRVDAREARRAAEGPLFQTHKATLELLPFLVFRYRCTLEGGKTSRDHEGEVWVSALNGAVSPAPEGDLVQELEMPFSKLPPTVDRERGSDLARAHLNQELTFREEVSQSFGEAAIIERVVLKPRQGSLQFEHVGSAFFPRWRVEGQNGTAFVDALTGELVQ